MTNKGAENGRSYGETFKRFTQCLKWAREGKTFIYWHPDFVAIDMKSWKKMEERLNPPPQNYHYDEWSDWTPEMEKMVEHLLGERLKKPTKPAPKESV